MMNGTPGHSLFNTLGCLRPAGPGAGRGGLAGRVPVAGSPPARGPAQKSAPGIIGGRRSGPARLGRLAVSVSIQSQWYTNNLH